MGRHRRVTPTPAPGVAPVRRVSRWRRPTVSVRTGLAGASAAVAMGAVAVATGVLPGPDGLGEGRQDADRVRADGTIGPDGLALPSASPSASPSSPSAPPSGESRTGAPSASHGADGGSADPDAPSPGRSAGEDQERGGPGAGTGAASPGDHTGGSGGSAGTGDGGAGAGERSGGREGNDGAGPSAGASSPADGSAAAAEAAVLDLVNAERAEAGCRAVTTDAGLADLAGDFSQDMADRDFFDHTSPDGRSPWDRARAQGVDDLGGENIARGQADARAVMDAWMNSPGHRANILNCDFRTLGVGVHRAEGGPWWTQEFGF